eukprot:4271835-Alexandrium_andersonii.AAC.1
MSAASDVYKRQGLHVAVLGREVGPGSIAAIAEEALGLVASDKPVPVSYTHLRAHETSAHL